MSVVLADRLRFEQAEGYMICGEAADEIEHLALVLQTERAAVVALRAEIDALRKTVEYFRAGQDQRYPKWVPSRVRLDGPVRGDYPIGHTTIAHDGEHECKSNRYGAVSVLAKNGQWLGVKPKEFEVVEWRENTPDAARKATP